MNIASMSQKEIVKMYQDELSDAKRRIAELEGALEHIMSPYTDVIQKEDIARKALEDG